MQQTIYDAGHQGVDAHLTTLTKSRISAMAKTRLHIRPPIINIAPSGCKYIALTQGKLTLVDEGDYEELMKWNWRYHWTGYAVRTESIGDPSISFRPRRMIHMHRRIMGEPEGLEIDHINGCRSDNRRCNLRIATRSQNVQNSRKHLKPTSSKHKGVTWQAKHGKWYSRVKCQGTIYHLGAFDNEIDAAMAYNIKALELFGPYAKLNEIEDGSMI